MENLYSILSDLNIRYDTYEHDPVHTCDEVKSLAVNIKGVHTKNLFLRDDKSRRHFLVVAPAEKSIALKDVSKRIGAKRLGFASPDRLGTYLGVDPGAVSPLVNTATIIMSMTDIQAIATSTAHAINFIEL